MNYVSLYWTAKAALARTASDMSRALVIESDREARHPPANIATQTVRIPGFGHAVLKVYRSFQILLTINRGSCVLVSGAIRPQNMAYTPVNPRTPRQRQSTRSGWGVPCPASRHRKDVGSVTLTAGIDLDAIQCIPCSHHPLESSKNTYARTDLELNGRSTLGLWSGRCFDDCIALTFEQTAGLEAVRLPHRDV